MLTRTLCLLVCLWVTGLHAQTTCGALATGKRIDGRVTTEQAPGWHVDADGQWTTCQVRPPSDCSFGLREWRQGNAQCTHWAYSPATLAHQRAYVLRTAPGPMDGMAVYRCDDGRLQQVMASCTDTRVCEVSEFVALRDGKAYRWAGRLELGATAQARAPDGSAITITCSSGVLTTQ